MYVKPRLITLGTLQLPKQFAHQISAIDSIIIRDQIIDQPIRIIGNARIQRDFIACPIEIDSATAERIISNAAGEPITIIINGIGIDIVASISISDIDEQDITIDAIVNPSIGNCSAFDASNSNKEPQSVPVTSGRCI